MKIFKGVLAFLFSILLLAPTNIHAQERFDIDQYDIHIKVNENGTLNITEIIEMDFSQYAHGFYRNIPVKYEMNWAELGKKTYYFPVSDISVLNDPYEVDTESDGVQIKIGDPDEYVYGKKRYEIHYTVLMRDLEIDQDYFYFNLIGNQFDCKINTVHFEIEMPKSFEPEKLQFSESVHYTINDHTITGNTVNTLYNYQGLTVFLPLGNDYFDFIPIQDYSFIMTAVCAVILLISIFLYVKFSKKKDCVITVEFNAPEGMSSASVGYIVDGSVDNQDVLSLIIDFASKGYLSIYEDKNDTILTKTKEISDQAAGFEKSFFHSLFMKKDEVSLHELEMCHFGDNIAAAKEQIFNHFHLKQNRIYSAGSLTVQILLSIFTGLAPALLSFCAYYLKVGMASVAILPLLIIWPLVSASAIFWIILSRKAHVYSRIKLVSISALAICCNLLTFSLSIIFLYQTPIYLVLALAYVIMMIFMIATSGRRSEQGNRWLGQILGLKEFIQTAEKDRLEMLVHDNPSYFYSILPFAYVLGISDVWSKKFESINVKSPDWYSSYDNRTFSTILWMNHFNHTMHSISTLSSAVTPPSSSSGGFSSGGGGFSGGGFGGGGGGSW